MTGLNTMENIEFGKIVDDWSCCDMTLNVYDQEKRLKYKINGGCCQCALMCKRYETCYEVCYFIYPANSKSGDTENAVGKIIRQKKDVVKSILTDADNFEIFFPENAAAYDKLMLIGATLMLDYVYFEESPGDVSVEDKKNKIHSREYHK